MTCCTPTAVQATYVLPAVSVSCASRERDRRPGPPVRRRRSPTAPVGSNPCQPNEYIGVGGGRPV